MLGYFRGSLIEWAWMKLNIRICIRVFSSRKLESHYCVQVGKLTVEASCFVHQIRHYLNNFFCMYRMWVVIFTAAIVALETASAAFSLQTSSA